MPLLSRFDGCPKSPQGACGATTNVQFTSSGRSCTLAHVSAVTILSKTGAPMTIESAAVAEAAESLRMTLGSFRFVLDETLLDS